MNAVHFDPASIPDYVYDRACTVLCQSVTRALSDPKLKQEYETWKTEQREK